MDMEPGTLGERLQSRVPRTVRGRLGIGLALGVCLGLVLPVVTHHLVAELAAIFTFSKAGVDALPAYEQVIRNFLVGMTLFVGLYLLPARAVARLGGHGGVGAVCVGAFGATWWASAAVMGLHPHAFALLLWAVALVLAFETHRWIQAGAPGGLEGTNCPECGYTTDQSVDVCPECETDIARARSTEQFTEVGPGI